MKKVELLSTLATVAFLSLLSACGGGDSGSGGSTPRSSSDRVADAQRRWPEQGGFAYDIRDSGCSTGPQSFTRKANYCLTLTSRSKNKGCGLETRERLYREDCGSDFEETGLPVRARSGYDPDLRQQCSAVDAGVKILDRLAEYCDHLRSENLHGGCFWADRHEEFRSLECKGAFSPRPIAPAPEPDPTPAPTPREPRPDPRPAPRNVQAEVTEKLKAAGIQVDVDYNAINRGGGWPGEPSRRQKMDHFWPKLAAAADEIIAMSGVVKKVSVTIYSSYRSSSADLSLDVDLAETSLVAYLTLLKRRIQVENAIGIELNLGVEVSRPDDLPKYASLVQFLESQQLVLKKYSSAWKTLELSDYSSFWLFDRTLRVKRDAVEEELKRFMKVFQPSLPFLDFLTAQEIELDGNIEFDKHQELFFRTLDSLKQLQKDLLVLKKKGELKRIEINYFASNTTFLSGEFSPAATGKESEQLDKALRAIVTVLETGESLGIDMETGYKINAEYIECATRLKAVLPLIREKRSKIRSIYFSSESKVSYGALSIGYKGTVRDLEKVIRDIR